MMTVTRKREEGSSQTLEKKGGVKPWIKKTPPSGSLGVSTLGQQNLGVL